MDEGIKAKICSIFREDDYCPLKPCRGCGFSFPEIERRKKLPLVKLDNGLYANVVGRRTPED